MKKHLLTGLSSLMLPMSIYALPSMLGGYQRSYLRAAIDSNNLRLSGRKHSLRDVPRPEVGASEPQLLTGAPVRELVIVDAAVPDKHLFRQQIRPGIDVIELVNNRDGLTQLARVLASYRDLNAVHIVSHAEQGTLLLGNSRISAQSIHDRLETFAAINGAIRAGGDLLFYGCNLAAGQSGDAFLDILQANTHADIAASDNLTGDAGQGGDWELEIHKGRIDTSQPFTAKALKDFSSVLLDQTITMDGFATGFTHPKTATYGAYTARLSLNGGDPDTNSLNCYAYYGNSRCIVDYSGSSSGDKKLYFDFTGGEQFNVTSFGLYSGYAQNFRISSDKGDSTDVNLSTNGTTVALNWTGITKLTIEKVDGSDISYARIDDMVLTGIGPPPPTITGATYDASTGALAVTGTNFVSAIGATNDIVANKFTFTGEGGATYTLTDTADVEIASSTSFTLTLSATDRTSINQIINRNGTSSSGGTTYNLAAAEDWGAGADPALSIADTTGNGITASNVAVPAITSTTYDVSIGELVVTGTGLLSASGATNDIVANKFTFTGEGGATYTLTDTANVEIASGTSFTLTLSATDRNAINQIINKNGTASTSGTTYNLAGAEDWAAGADPAVVVADTTGNGITVSNVAVPTIASATYDASTGALAVTGTNFLSASGATNDIVANKFTFVGEGGDTYTLTDTSNVEIASSTNFTLTLSATDRPGVNVILNQNGTFSIDSTTYNLGAADDWAAGADPAVNVADTTGNGITVSNALPLPTVTDANIAISGASGTGGVFKIGDTVTATWNNTAGGDNSASISSVTVNFSAFGGGAAVAASNSSGTWTATYTVVAGAIDATNRNISVTATNATGGTTAADTTNATVDNAAPTVTDARISISGGSGDEGAYIVGDTVTGTWNNTAGGDNNSDTISSVTANFTEFGGGAAVAASNSSGTWTATYTIVAGAIENTSRNISVTATDNAGNTTTRADTSNAAVDNVAPVVASVGVPPNATYVAENNLNFTVYIASASDVVVDTVGGTPRIALTIGATTRYATYISGSSSLTFRYTVQSGDLDSNGISVAGVIDANGGTLEDGSGNALNLTLHSIGSTAAVLVDAAVPTAGIVVADTALAAGETSGVTITFSEAVTGFSNVDLTVDNGSLSAVSSGDGGITWMATLTPTADITDATNAITLDNTGVNDAGGNAGSGSTDSNNYAVDTARPTATLVVTDTTLAAGETSGVTITFNEAVTGFTNVDLAVGNGTLSAVSSADGGITWTATLTPTADVTDSSNVITLSNGGVTDAAGNTGTGTTDSNNYAVDTSTATATIVVADTELNAGETSLVTITFSEAVTGFANDDLTFANGSLSAVSSSDGGITWTATFTPDPDIDAPTNVITLDNTSVDDASGNAGTGTTDSNDFIIRTLAASLLVTTNLDSGDDATSAASLTDDGADGGGLSLREALSWSRPGDTITFDFDSVAADGQGGTITLNGNALAVAYSNLSIDGDLDDDGAADVTISANNASRVMLISNSLSGIELTGLTLTDGVVSGGGAGVHIGSGSSVTVRSSNITNSSETGLGGGGVYGTSVSLTMIDSTASGNSSSAFGGGIRIVGAGATLNLINSTVSGNTTTGIGAHGGGIQYGGSGGALTVVNSTISGNTAAGATSLGGGLRVTSGISYVYSSTIVGNASTDSGGGVFANGTDTFVNTVVAGNTSGAGATAGASGSPLATGGVADDVGGTIETATHNFFGTTAVITTDNGSLNGQGTGNLLLGNLGDNGGQVLTHRPQTGSALIDAGSNADLPVDAFDIDGDSDTSEALPRDANGNNRISAAVEIGAVEVNDPPLASDDSAVTNEDMAVEIDVLANDSDSDGTLDASSVALGVAPAHGTVIVNADGSITYTPSLNWNGADSFSYSVADDVGERSNTATVSISITAVNDLPVIAGTPSNVVNSGMPYTFTPTVSDVESQPLTVTATNLPGWATLNASTGAMTGTPGYADAGTYSGIVLTVGDGIATSSLPAFSIVVVGTVDRDGDGMSDVFEQTYGLDPNDASDAGDDLDGDGVSNLDEYLADRDPTVDDYPPVLSSPAPITIDAAGLLTPMPALSPPSAVDSRDGALTASLTGNRSHLEPGTHILTWRATDAAGNRGETLQAINVRPLISLARDQITGEGTTARVRVILNGLSPSYPLSVAYIVNGTADANDHDLSAGTIVFQQGEIEKSIAVQIVDDGIAEGEETIEVALTGEGNFGVRTHVIRIVEANIAPTLQWSIMQGGRSVRIVTQDQGPVTLSAAVSDANADDSHTYEWSMPAGVTATNVGDAAKIFDPSIVAPGVYRVELTVSDDGTPAQSTRSSQLFQVIATVPALSDSADSDGDGIDDGTEGLTDQDGDGQPDYLDANDSPNVLNESAGDGGLFLLEADPGVRLSLGDRAMAHGADGAQLSSGELGAQGDIGPDSIANVGGYFDLTIRDLPEVGASVNLVIPQRQAIPQHPLYRKFLNGQWTTFAENAANRLASASGTQGVCPPPGSSEYRAGLNPGDWCVRLTLEDGGPNDADGTANAAVEDPGGVGQVANVTSTTRGGGGALGTPLLMLLLIMALHRLQRLNAKRAGAAAIALAVAVTIPAQVNAADSADSGGLYVTGTFGYAKTQISKSEMQSAFAADGIDSTLHSVEGDRAAWGVGIGYPLADRWSLEAGYLDLGDVKLRFDTLATETNLAQVHPLSAEGATLSGLYRIPISERVMARARLGAFIWSSDYTTRRADERIDVDDDSGIDILWGLSLGYDLSSAWTINLELQRIELDDEPTHVVGMQLQWHVRGFGN